MYNMFKQAARPQDLRVALVWQVHHGVDEGFVRVAGPADAPWRGQIREVRIPAGACAGPAASWHALIWSSLVLQCLR